MALPYSLLKDGVRLAVRLTPRASRSGVDGIAADGRPALQVRLAAPPVDGLANAALVALLAEALDLRKADVRLRSGHRSRLKIVDLTGDPTTILAKLAAMTHGEL